MKNRYLIFISFILQTIYSQSTTSFNYLTLNGSEIEISIDTIKYRPKYVEKIVLFMHNDDIDADISIHEVILSEKDTASYFLRSRNQGEFNDLGKINGERTMTLKKFKTRNGVDYVIFSYAKFVGQNKVIVFTVKIAPPNFIKYEEDFIEYAQSMKVKKLNI